MTHKEQQLYRFIYDYQTLNRGVSPSFEEMMYGIDVNSKSGIFRLLNSLEEQGMIVRGHNRHRRITVLLGPSTLSVITDDQLAEEASRRGMILCRIGGKKPSDGPLIASVSLTEV